MPLRPSRYANREREKSLSKVDGRYKITWQDLLILAGVVGFAVLWIFVIIPIMSTGNWYYSLNPVLQYLLFNIGFLALITIFFGLPFALNSKSERKILKTFLYGLSSYIIISFIIDMWLPPYYLSPSGQILITSNAAFSYTAVDAMTSWLWNAAGIVYGTHAIYIMTYVITPIIAGVFSIILFRPEIILGAFGVETSYKKR